VVKEGIGCVNNEIYKSAEVSESMKKNDKECGDMGMRMNKGVFGTGENGKEQEENGEKVVVFYEELVKEGSKKWKFTVCGLFNIPLEAWSVRGINALASRLWRPIKMDQVTSEICKAGVGRLGYARVLIEINAEDEFLDKIEINYVDEMRKVNSTKWVRVEYAWKPNRCNHLMERKEKEDSDEEDVYEVDDQSIKGFIVDEVLDNSFGTRVDSAGRRNVDEVDVMVVWSCSQTLLCLVEVNQTKVKLFVSLVYASSSVNLVNEYIIVAKDELKLLHQKAKLQWLKECDKNSTYFHNILKARKNKNRIESICCEDGSRVEVGDIVKLELSLAEALDMIKDVSDNEIKETLFDIDSSKDAGPDGYTSCFFKNA
nr:ATPase, F1/V1/A1 complex, alpha/beta subunit, zinc knuckle CX2CX4HX4C [Tanacetum cinerariifolium]